MLGFFRKNRPPIYTQDEWNKLTWECASTPKEFEARQNLHWLVKEILKGGGYTLQDYLTERKRFLKNGQRGTSEERAVRMDAISDKRIDKIVAELAQLRFEEPILKDLMEKPIIYARPQNFFEDLNNPTRDFSHHYGLPAPNISVFRNRDVLVDKQGHCYKLPPDDIHPLELRTLELYCLLTDPFYQRNVFARQIRNPYFRVLFWETIVSRIKEFSDDPKERKRLLRLKGTWPTGVNIKDPFLPRIDDPSEELLKKWGWKTEPISIQVEF